MRFCDVSGLPCNLSTENSDITQGLCVDMAVWQLTISRSNTYGEIGIRKCCIILQSASGTEFFDHDFVGTGFPVTRESRCNFHDQDSIGSDNMYFGSSTQCFCEYFDHRYIENNIERMG